jgi:pimeloyl-ACP methyl ester carboxylesterase
VTDTKPSVDAPEVPGSFDTQDPPDIDATGPAVDGARRPDRSRWVSSAGLRIATYEWGEEDRPVILMAHGGFDFAGTFDVFAPMLADAGYRVVSWDARGHGSSEPAVIYSRAVDLPVAAAVLDSWGPDAVVGQGHW